METTVKKLYEGMFLIDSAQAAGDWDGSIKVITDVLEKSEAEIISIRKWDECRLAYEIDHKTRGTYLLCYFRADGEKIRELERSIQLSERIMRVLILKADHLTEEDMEKETPATKAEKKIEAAEEKAGEKTVEPEGTVEVTANKELGTEADKPHVDEIKLKPAQPNAEPGAQQQDNSVE